MGWERVASVSEVDEGEVIEVSVEGEPLALYNLGGNFYATHNICTHAQACLSDGFVDEEYIECPLHQGLFHIPTGKVVEGPPTEDVRTYPVKIEDDSVFVWRGE